MDVSIIIVSYNTVDLLRNCLESIINNTHNINYEIIVSDNGSKDGSVEMIKRDYQGVILIENNKNIGFGAANNCGLKRAVGKYILYLNSDTVLLNNAVKIFYDYWENYPEKEFLGGVGGVLLDKHLNTIHSGSSLPTYTVLCRLQLMFIKFHFVKSLIALFHLEKYYKALQKHKDTYECVSPGEIGYITGADLFLLNNGDAIFDESFFMYSEETDLQYRMTKKGKRFFLIEGPRIVHLTHKEYLDFKVERLSVVFMQESFLIYAKKHFFNKCYLLKILILLDRVNPFLWNIVKQGKRIYYESR